MKLRVLFCITLAVVSSCASAPPINSAPPPYSVIELPPSADGQKAIMLSQSLRDPNQPQILDVEILPDQGMNIYQMKANIPGLGVVDLLKPGDADDFNGALVLSGSIINVSNMEVTTARNLATQHSFKTTVETTSEHGMITGLLQEKDSDVQLPGKIELAITVSLQRNSFSLGVFVKNNGDQPIPIAIGWHPLFRFPKTDRARLRMAIEPQSDSRGVLLPPGETTKYAVELELLRPSR